jgi:HAD superfamily 5'-nucleotidase-like hydrolase
VTDRADRKRAPPAGAGVADPALAAILERTRPLVREVPLARQVFVNRNLRMDRIEAVGFDMDYTLAIYQLRRMEELAFDLTVDRMVRTRGWPGRLRGLRYDPDFAIRGLVVDKEHGNIFKMDRHNHVGRAYHGLVPLPRERRYELYREEKVRLSSPRFAWIDTLFALPEAALYAHAIQSEEADGHEVDYGRLYRDIRESIDEVHRDGTLKEVVKRDLGRYVVKDPELGPALHKLRSGGKHLFLLTNSAWDYTDAVMGHLLDGMLPEYPAWRNYFDAVVTAAAKPAFFADGTPFRELGPDGTPVEGAVRALERGKAYAGGNLADLERLLEVGADRVLYVGDHIYGDILRSKKSSLWRTCLVVEELEREIDWLESHRAELDEVARLEELRLRIDDETAAHRTALNVLDRRLDRLAPGAEGRPAVEAERQQLKRELELLRGSLRDADARIAELQATVEDGYNRYWGLTFKEVNDNSRFGEQIEDYACLYTSRVSNFLFYSPMQYFRSRRKAMPHEPFALTLAPYGEEHAAAAGPRTRFLDPAASRT